MESLKEKLIRIAKQKIQSTQSKQSSKNQRTSNTRKQTNKRSAKPRNRVQKPRAINVRSTKKQTSKQSTAFFPITPLSFYRFNRPHEARLQSNYEHSTFRKFNEEFIYRNQTNNYKFEDFLIEAQKHTSSLNKNRKNN